MYHFFNEEIQQKLCLTGIMQRAEQEQQDFAEQLTNPNAQVPLLKNLARYEVVKQMQHPIKVLTSGLEVQAKNPFYNHGKWRMTRRIPWWEHYQAETPVIIGHYWRGLSHIPASGVFMDIPPMAWLGQKKNIFCIDYSVGKRYLDRKNQQPFSSYLMALRWPERTLMREDGQSYPTQAFLQDSGKQQH